MSNQAIVPFKEQVNVVRGLLNKMKDQFLMALPRHVKVDSFLRVAITSVQRNPDLLKCTQESLLGSLMQAAQLGLQVDGLLGEAHLVPFNNKQKNGGWKKEAQLIVGYKGLMKLGRNSGEVSAFHARAVFMKDHLVIQEGLDPKLEYMRSEEPPALAEGESLEDHIRGAYALVRYKDGSCHFVFLWKWEIDRARAASKNRSGSAWVTNYPEMAEKTAMRRLAKWMPQSTELQRAAALEERADAGLSQELESLVDINAEVTPESDSEEDASPAEKKSELVQALDAQKAKSQPAPDPAAPASKREPPPKYADSEPDPTKPGGDLFGKEF